jgi:hypothetical protein
MKKIFNKIYLLMLTMVFSFGGYYVGSRDQKIDIALPGPATPAVNQNVAGPAPVAKTVVISNKSSPPVQNTNPQTTSSQQTAQVTPAPTPAPVPAPAPTPTPKTAVS